MEMEKLYRAVLEAIDKVINDFKRNKNLFLTEGDLECRLFKELQEKFPKEEQTGDRENITSYVHSQIRYFEKERLNKNRVDIVVVPLENFDFSDNKIVFRKGYAFNEPSVAIEVKLNKRLKSKSALRRIWKTDLEKLNRLQTSRGYSKFISILLDKNKVFCKTELKRIKKEYATIKIIYIG